MHESAPTASVVADFKATAAEKKFSIGTDRKASSPASIVLTAGSRGLRAKTSRSDEFHMDWQGCRVAQGGYSVAH